MTNDHDLTTDERALLDALSRLPDIEPRADLQARFSARARGAPAKGSPVVSLASRHPWLPALLAASLVLAVTMGWWLEHRRRTAETAALRAELTLALNDLSAATRMQGIARVEQAASRDPRITGSLIEALLNDPSANVRVAAAEALAIVASPETFAGAAGRAFASERSPFVQAALLGGASKLPTAARASLIQILLARPDLDADVRARASRQSSSL
jgi:hypothetical protein